MHRFCFIGLKQVFPLGRHKRKPRSLGITGRRRRAEMTYRSQGRSQFEVVLAVTYVGFMVGFVAVLCVGNYFRAVRAAERQRQNRLDNQGSARVRPSSPRSGVSGDSSLYGEEGHGESVILLGQYQTANQRRNASSNQFSSPQHSQQAHRRSNIQQGQAEKGSPDLLSV